MKFCVYIEKLDFDGKLWITPEVIGNASQCGTHITESVQCRKKQFELEKKIFFYFLKKRLSLFSKLIKRKNIKIKPF